LAIDLSRYKSVVCVSEQALAELRFMNIDTTGQELHNVGTAHAACHRSMHAGRE
jgi:hypothetical protein